MSLLTDNLQAVDWNENVSDFVAGSTAFASYERGCHLIAVWAHELRFQHHDNPAKAFLLEMQASINTVPACASLGLYKPAAASMRSAVENALYYSYFSTHTMELHSQVSRSDYYETKASIIAFHKAHTPEFNEKQIGVGLLSELEAWYSEISAIIHGQKPGTWSVRKLSSTAFDVKLDALCAMQFSRCIAIINMLFLITSPDDVWEGFNSKSKKLFFKGFSKTKKMLVGRSLV